jgi:hypothetical protein
MSAEAILEVWRGEGRVEACEVNSERAPDFALARRAAQGDMDAFEEIFRRQRRLVYGLCLRMTQDVALLEALQNRGVR